MAPHDFLLIQYSRKDSKRGNDSRSFCLLAAILLAIISSYMADGKALYINMPLPGIFKTFNTIRRKDQIRIERPFLS